MDLQGPAPPRVRGVFATSDRREQLTIFILILLTAVAIRGWEFGNPRIDVDENFYLLVGDRMLHGAWPYVDIWDRKPVGLFLIYAAIRLLGGGGIFQYQLVATIFAAATGIVIARMGRKIAGPIAAVAAAMVYLLMLGLAGGGGGQSPVFYNLPVALAASIALDICVFKREDAHAARDGAAAMLLIGIAIQIKYTAVFEGVFFGLALLVRSWCRSRSLARTGLDGTLWVATALLPTLLALTVYYAAGHANDFVYANFLSIGGRSVEPTAEVYARLVKTSHLLVIPLCEVLVSVLLGNLRTHSPIRMPFGFFLAWLAAAFTGYFIFGTYFNHYALPLLPPLCVSLAPAFNERRKNLGIVLAMVTIILGIYFNVRQIIVHDRNWGSKMAVEAITSQIDSRLRGCLYVFRGDPILYYTTNSCLLSRYAFPTHLTLRREAGAIGIDPLAEIRRIFALRPAIVIDTIADDERDDAADALALGRDELARNYQVVASVQEGKSRVIIYERHLR